MDGAVGKDWEGREGGKNVTCSEGGAVGGTWARQEGCSGRCKWSVMLERRERYAWLCDSSYIEHSVCWHCLLYLTEEQTFPIGTVQSFLFPSLLLHTPQWSKRTLPSSSSKGFLISDLNKFSVSLPCVCLINTCFLHKFFELAVHFSLLPLSVSVEFSYVLHEWETAISASATIKHSMEERPLLRPILQGHCFTAKKEVLRKGKSNNNKNYSIKNELINRQVTIIYLFINVKEAKINILTLRMDYMTCCSYKKRVAFCYKPADSHHLNQFFELS